jgi:ABC-type transport system involved in Fe-S cluster assembly fused permease/ATPase subunit
MQHYTNKKPKYQCEEIAPHSEDTAVMVKQPWYVFHLCMWKVELVTEIYYIYFMFQLTLSRTNLL